MKSLVEKTEKERAEERAEKAVKLFPAIFVGAFVMAMLMLTVELLGGDREQTGEPKAAEVSQTNKVK